MSAPQTNLEKQKKRHRGPLIGITLVTVAAVLLIFYWVTEEVAGSDPASPGGTISAPASQIPAETIPATPTPAPGTLPSTNAPAPAPQN